MEYRTLGRTDIRVSAVCLGCWSLIGDETWGEQKESDSVAAIHRALDAGVNFLDTAEMYGAGRSEELLGKVLAGKRDKVVIGSKVGPASLRPEALKERLDASLRRLRTDYIDLYQVHWPNPEVPVAETLGVLEELKTAGKIRAAGVSNFGRSYLGELLEAGRVESNQVCYSLLWRPVEYEVKPLCVENGISVLCYSALCQGLLTGKFTSPGDVPVGRARTRLFSKDRPMSRHKDPNCEEDVFAAIATIRKACEGIGLPMGQVALAWLLAQKGVTSVVCGARNAEQASENAAASELKLDKATLKALAAATERVKRHIGKNCDMWQSESRLERPAKG